MRFRGLPVLVLFAPIVASAQVAGNVTDARVLSGDGENWFLKGGSFRGDHYTPLEEHFDLLRAAGFVELDCVWRNWIWGIIHARRPA